MASVMPHQFNQRAVEQSVRNGTPIKNKGGATPSVSKASGADVTAEMISGAAPFVFKGAVLGA
jgi:hypothetical protein